MINSNPPSTASAPGGLRKITVASLFVHTQFSNSLSNLMISNSFRFLSLFSLLAAIVLPAGFSSAQNLPDTTRLLRFPTTNGDQVVFCYAGELYTVGKQGGTARRLTSGPGYS